MGDAARAEHTNAGHDAMISRRLALLSAVALAIFYSRKAGAMTNIIDHIVTKPTEAELVAAIGNYRVGWGPLYMPAYYDEDYGYTVPGHWRPDICSAVNVIDITDPANPVLVPGFHIWIGLLNRDAFLEPLCLLLGSRDDATILVNNIPAGKTYMLTPTIGGSIPSWSTGVSAL